MPEIQIRKEWLEGDTNRTYVIGLLTAYMAWPDNEIERDRVICHAKTVLNSHAINHYHNIGEPIPATIAMTMLEAAWDSAPKELDNKKMTKRVSEGAFVAAELMEALWHAHQSGHLKAYWSKENGPFTNLMGKRLKKGLSKGNIQRIWQRIRPVAHLFLARQYLFKDNPNLPFPSNPDHLINFLTLAEKFRNICENKKPDRSREAIMNPQSSFKIVTVGFSLEILDEIFASEE